jgi:hypothetical protein
MSSLAIFLAFLAIGATGVILALLIRVGKRRTRAERDPGLALSNRQILGAIAAIYVFLSLLASAYLLVQLGIDIGSDRTVKVYFLLALAVSWRTFNSVQQP